MSTVPSPSPHHNQDSGVISDLPGLGSFGAVCREEVDKISAQPAEAEVKQRRYHDVIIGFISGAPTGCAFVQGGSLNATVRELYLTQPEVLVEKIRKLFLAEDTPVNIILHKTEIRDGVLALFEQLVKDEAKHNLVTLIVIKPVHQDPKFLNWNESRKSADAATARGNVYTYQSSAVNLE